MAIQISKKEYEQKFGQLSQPAKPESSSWLNTIDNYLKGSVKDQFNSGIQATKEGFTAAGNSRGVNPLPFLENVGKGLSGVATTITSPFAPVAKPVNYALENVSGARGQFGLSNLSPVQKFANTKAGEVTSRVAEDVANLANVAETVGGAFEAPRVNTIINKTATKALTAGDEAVAGSGRVLKRAGEKLYDITVPQTKSTAERTITYDAKQPNILGRVKNLLTGEDEGRPITEANTAARHGLFGTEYRLGVQAKQVQAKLWDTVIAPKLQAVKGTTTINKFLDSVQKEINKTRDLSRRGTLSEALQKVREDYSPVRGKINLETLQKYKEGWAEFIPDASYNGKPIAGALKAVNDIMASKAREIIYKNIGEEGKVAYIDYGNLKSLVESAKKSLTGDPATKSISRNVWQFVMDKAVTPIATTAGKVLYKTGEGLEFVGKPGARNISDVLGLTIKNTSPRAEELGYKINELNAQWVKNPTPANKKALDSAKSEYYKALQEQN